ncbi:MAG TPA: hypothetical protein VMK32_08165 [Burkholderiaceae bacterium]|nr:hypothetical protein [Burkholderiaceae bacterium]
MDFVDIDAPPLLARSGAELRPVAQRFARAYRALPLQLTHRSTDLITEGTTGRVHAGGAFEDEAIHTELALALADLGPALRPRFEWYWCRGAFFHTDAHYADVMFGVWAVAGPPSDIVFARSGQRVEVSAGTIVVFDPFEVHGVLRRGAERYEAVDYADHTAVSVFAGFELAIDAVVRACFGISSAAPDARILSSTTRVSAETGRLD